MPSKRFKGFKVFKGLEGLGVFKGWQTAGWLGRP